MLHLDGSKRAWLSLLPEEKQTPITVVDDATSRLLYAQSVARGEHSGGAGGSSRGGAPAGLGRAQVCRRTPKPGH